MSAPPAAAPVLAGVPLPVAVALAGAMIVGALVQARRRQAAYRAAARELGLAWQPESVWSRERTVMRGRLRGFEVAASIISRDKRLWLEVVVDGAWRKEGGIPPALKLARQRAGLSLFSEEDLIVGDPAFDRSVRVGGGATVALATLGGEARAAFLEALALRPGVELADGRLTVSDGADQSQAQVVACVRSALSLAEALVLPAAGLAATLVRRAVDDAAPGVRLGAFRVLAGGVWPPGLLEDVARALLRDPHPELRLRAAMSLGDAGFAHLAGVVGTPAPATWGGDADDGKPSWWRAVFGGAEAAPDEALLETPSAHERRRARALAHLAARHPREHALPLVRDALRETGRPLQAVALAALAKVGDPSFEPAAIDALPSTLPAARRGAAAGQVALTGEAGAAGRLALAPATAVGAVALVDRAREG